MSVLPEIDPANPPANLEEYVYVSSQANNTYGVFVNVGGVPTDPDNSTVLVSFLPDAPGSTPVFSGISANRVATGVYNYTFLSTDTQVPGYYHLAFVYQINGVPDTFLLPIQVGQYNPAYDMLAPEAKAIIDLVWSKFADGYDSPNGGPNIQSYFQSHFSRGRLAQLLYMRLQVINGQAQPVNSWSLTAQNPVITNNDTTLDGAYPPGTTPPALPPGTSPPWPPYGTPPQYNTQSEVAPLVTDPNYPVGPAFPYATYSGLLISGLTVDVIKHLMRSYVEEPLVEGASSARLSRRDYLDRWGSILADEEREYKEQLEVFKIRQMFLLQPSVLVSGGVYGTFVGPQRLAGSAAARPVYFARLF